jgi:hypothetical protein
MVGVALPTDLAVGHDVQPYPLLFPDPDQGRVELRFGRVGLVHPPQLSGADPRREPPGELDAVDQPFRLRVAANQRGGKEHSRPPGGYSTRRGAGWRRPARLTPAQAPKQPSSPTHHGPKWW